MEIMEEQDTTFLEVEAAQLEPTLQGYWKKAQETIQLDNHKYAVTLLQAILKEAPGFVEGRKALRDCESTLVGGPKKKRGLFGTKVGAAPPSVSKKYLSMLEKEGGVKALDAIEKELEKDPFATNFNEALHDVAAELGMVQTAAQALETVKEAFPEETTLMHKLAEYYLSKDLATDAARIYEAAVKANPADIDAVKGAKDATAKASMLSNKQQKYISNSWRFLSNTVTRSTP